MPVYNISTKTYKNLPCSHRQHRHEGQCARIHGYSREITFHFAATEVDKCGFVVDFGSLKWLKTMLDELFDHTLLLAPDDPLLPKFRELEELGACTLVLLPYGPGMEGTARFLCEHVDEYIRNQTSGRCWVLSVECRENDKNSGIYMNPSAGSYHV